MQIPSLLQGLDCNHIMFVLQSVLRLTIAVLFESEVLLNIVFFLTACLWSTSLESFTKKAATDGYLGTYKFI